MTGPLSPRDGHRAEDVVLLARPERERVAIARALVAQVEGQDVEAVGDEIRDQAQGDPAARRLLSMPGTTTTARPVGRGAGMYQPRRIVPSRGLGNAISS